MRKIKVFISYAREDFDTANQIYNILKKEGFEPWLDQYNILPGQKWKDEISKAINKSEAFIVILSKISVTKRGYIQKEVKFALDVLKELPANQIFIIPARIEKINPSHPELADISWVDLHESRDNGIKMIIKSLNSIALTYESIEEELYQFENTISTDLKYISFIKELPTNSARFGNKEPVYIDFVTNYEEVKLPEFLLKKYPTIITIVLQYEYKDLIVKNEKISVTLWFSGEETKVEFPVNSITLIEQGDIKIERRN